MVADDVNWWGLREAIALCAKSDPDGVLDYVDVLEEPVRTMLARIILRESKGLDDIQNAFAALPRGSHCTGISTGHGRWNPPKPIRRVPGTPPCRHIRCDRQRRRLDHLPRSSPGILTTDHRRPPNTLRCASARTHTMAVFRRSAPQQPP